MRIEIVEHRASWKDDFERERKNLEDILKDEVVNIFHIGSSSVEGLRSKPIIDILLVVRSLDKLDECVRDFENLGYEAMGEYGIEKRRFFKKGKDKRSHHIHAFEYENIYEIERHLLFRDYLRIDSKAREDYGKLKYKLSKIYSEDIEGYCAGKDKFVKEIEKKSILWHYYKRK